MKMMSHKMSVHERLWIGPLKLGSYRIGSPEKNVLHGLLLCPQQFINNYSIFSQLEIALVFEDVDGNH